MTPTYRTHDERVTAQIATAKDKALLAETAWLIIEGGPISTTERQQARKAIRSAHHACEQILADPTMKPERKREIALEHARTTLLVEAVKPPARTLAVSADSGAARAARE